MHFLVGRAKQAGRAQTQLTKELVSLLTDTLDNLKPLKAMGAQQEFVAFFDRRLHRLRRALRRQVINREATAQRAGRAARRFAWALRPTSPSRSSTPRSSR